MNIKGDLDEREFIENHLSILNTENKLVPFKFNRVQELYDERKTGNDIILKARKMGLSTRIIASDLYACAFIENTHAVMLTHTDDARNTMMKERVLPMLRSNDFGIRFKETADQIYFPTSNSTYYSGTAGTRRFGRGDDITRGHLMEAAHYSRADVLTGVEEAMLDNGVLRIETTANGDNFFKKLWDESKAGRTRYRPIFFPWYCDPRYSLSGGDPIGSVSEKEKELMETIGLKIEQIAWRRWKIKSMSRPELFPQEYPETDMEAFISSGRSVFDWLALVKQERACSKPLWVGRVKEFSGGHDFEPSEGGELSVWEAPKNGGQYVIGADVAEGIEGGAYSVACVLDIKNMTQVAEWHGHIAPDLFGQALIDLSIYYNRAWVAPESWPGPGETTTSYIENQGYNRLFQFPNEDIFGWRTTAQSKQRMVYETSAALRDLLIQVKSHDLISELRSFIYDEKKRMIPSRGTFSDRVIALGIAYMMSQQVEIIRENLKTRGIIKGQAFTVPQWRGPLPGIRQE